MPSFTQTIPLSLYIHLPWCVKKCPYCDFNSHALRKDLPEQLYIDKLLEDLDQDLPLIWGRRISSIFMGGGTPSLFSAAAIERLLNEIRARLPFQNDLEITMEANPGTFEQERFKAYREAGVNRLSLGVQSFQDEKLQALGRIHQAQEAKQAAETLHQIGFENFNIDLMFGLPTQTSTDALFDINTAINLAPTHISWYQLTIEPNTYFQHFPPALPSDENIWEIQQQGQARLAQAGYTQYEVSAYSKANRLCAHNLNYWQFGDYLGIGAGAHAKITDVNQQTITRLWKIKHPKDYLKATNNFIDGKKTLAESEIPFEFMLNALRLNQAISFALFSERTGLPIKVIEQPLEIAKQKGLLTVVADHIALTQLGKRFVNDVVELFLNE